MSEVSPQLNRAAPSRKRASERLFPVIDPLQCLCHGAIDEELFDVISGFEAIPLIED